MAVRDIEAFLRERAVRFDSTLDVDKGSPFDTQVIQPLVRRLGTDPFTVDISTFLRDRMRQAYPDMAVDEGDAITDLFIKPITLAWDPLVRETFRVQQNQSFKDPTTLTIEEAEALGANLFAERSTGGLSRGQARIFFKQPQSITITPVNFITSKGGLHFFPTEAQTIRVDEMLLNLASDSTYYFDFNVIAEAAGDKYNIGPNELVSIANVESAVKVTNLKRFGGGINEDSAEEFVEKARGELTERSLVTLRGVSAQLTRAFPEVRRLNVVGYNDPEMQRDVLKGGGYGPILATGTHGTVVDDTENKDASRRFSVSGDSVDFTLLIGPTTVAPNGFVLTVVQGVDSLTAPPIQDFEIAAVIDSTTLSTSAQEFGIGRTDLVWSLRKKELTLSDIPGGILFPDGPQGTVTVVDDEVHVGGCSDVYVRATSFEESTLVIDAVTDDDVELSGVDAQPVIDLFGAGVPGFVLNDFVLGTNFSTNSPTFRLLESASVDGFTLQIVTGPNTTNFGVYRVIQTEMINGQPVKLQVIPNPTTPLNLGDPNNSYRWRLFDKINIDLLNPKETRITESDLIAVQNYSIVRSAGAINFNDFGVSQGDVLEIKNGPDKGKYKVTAAPLAPGFDRLQLDTKLKNTTSNLSYSIYRANSSGGVELPLIRITKVELLDSSNQPIGTTIPYANPIDVQSRAFQNPGHGVKHTLTDVELGIISQPTTAGNFGNPSSVLQIEVSYPDGTTTVPAPAAIPSNATIATAVTAINAALAPLGLGNSAFAYDSTRLAIRPGKAGIAFTGGTPLFYLFGSTEPRTTADIRSASVPNWDQLNPSIDFLSGLDIVQVVSGRQVGFYTGPFSGPASTSRPYQAFAASASIALIVKDITISPSETTVQFAPEDRVRLELGSRSLGSARCYFLEPTTCEFTKSSVFTYESPTGTIRFLPDPSLNTQIVPPLPSDSKSNAGSSADGLSTFTDTTQNFLRSAVGIGDKLVIDYVPLAGSITLADPVSNLAGKTFVFSLDDSADLQLTFIRDDVSIATTDVTIDGVAEQINAKAGAQIVHLTGTNTLEFRSDALLTIKPGGTANPLILGTVAGSVGPVSFSSNTVTNESPHAGEYTVIGVQDTALSVLPVFPVSNNVHPGPTITLEGYRVYRSGSQRLSSTQMSEQVAEASLYYMDVELVSEGVGDLWNIDASKQLTVENFKSDGWYLTTDKSIYTFSILEEPKLVMSKSVLEAGVDDDATNATSIVGQNLQISYETSSIVQDVQAFITSDVERVSVQSALCRHLIPVFVRFDLNYTGGSAEEVISTDEENYINGLYPSDALESSDVQAIPIGRGATSVTNPIDLIGVVHNIDRTVSTVRSQNAITTGRLNAFIPDILNIKRNTN